MPGRKAAAGKTTKRKAASTKAAARKPAANKAVFKKPIDSKPATIPEYIALAPPESRKHLLELYAILRRAAPWATEAIKWKVPVFEDGRILFAFGAFRTHLNFMPTPSVMKALEKELSGYKTGKGTVHFPYDKPLPKALIRKLANRRVLELREFDARWM